MKKIVQYFQLSLSIIVFALIGFYLGSKKQIIEVKNLSQPAISAQTSQSTNATNTNQNTPPNPTTRVS